MGGPCLPILISYCKDFKFWASHLEMLKRWWWIEMEATCWLLLSHFSECYLPSDRQSNERVGGDGAVRYDRNSVGLIYQVSPVDSRTTESSRTPSHCHTVTQVPGHISVRWEFWFFMGQSHLHRQPSLLISDCGGIIMNIDESSTFFDFQAGAGGWCGLTN